MQSNIEFLIPRHYGSSSERLGLSGRIQSELQKKIYEMSESSLNTNILKSYLCPLLFLTTDFSPIYLNIIWLMIQLYSKCHLLIITQE